jgi:hypothetical protein
MGRIRTIKPEFFLNDDLADLDEETGLPVRLAYIGLWCQCDREGRFEWRPKRLKPQILPYDSTCMERVLHALTTRGFVVKYVENGREFGWIPGFAQHQVVNNKERNSTLPSPNENNILTRECREGHALTTREVRVPQGKEGNKEGKGREHLEDANASLSPEDGDDEPAVEQPLDNPPPKPSAPIPICPAGRIVDAYNRICTSMPRAKYDSWSEPNKRKLRARWKWLMSRPIDGEEGGPTFSEDVDAALAWWDRFFQFVQDQCPHLVGENDRGWTADLLWLICPTNFDKVKGGSYRRQQVRSVR